MPMPSSSNAPLRRIIFMCTLNRTSSQTKSKAPPSYHKRCVDVLEKIPYETLDFFGGIFYHSSCQETTRGFGVAGTRNLPTALTTGSHPGTRLCFPYLD